MAKGVTFPRIGGIIGQAEWRSYVGLIETWDVLKFLLPYKLSLNQLINRNMRCIEITWRGKQLAICEGLIETWDVLKCVN